MALIQTTLIPRITELRKEVAEARSTLAGRIVDSYTNIQTVKMFAHADREDGYARDGMTPLPVRALAVEVLAEGQDPRRAQGVERLLVGDEIEALVHISQADVDAALAKAKSNAVLLLINRGGDELFVGVKLADAFAAQSFFAGSAST